jgi:hypothetical protein
MKRKLRYSHIDVLIADPVKPTPEAKRTYQLTRMWQGLHALTTSDKATIDDWAVVSDAINLMETLLEMGWMQDLDGALDEAAKAMSDAGERHQNGAPLRLTDEESEIIRGTLEDYAGALESLSHRVMVSAHRKTQQRIHDILDGKLKPHDVKFI